MAVKLPQSPFSGIVGGIALDQAVSAFMSSLKIKKRGCRELILVGISHF